jgi:hypothetical protein
VPATSCLPSTTSRSRRQTRRDDRAHARREGRRSSGNRPPANQAAAFTLERGEVHVHSVRASRCLAEATFASPIQRLHAGRSRQALSTCAPGPQSAFHPCADSCSTCAATRAACSNPP